MTLIAGRNSVGKTTVLNAIQVYAARGRPEVLQSLLEESQEWRTVDAPNGNTIVVPDKEALFHRGQLERSSTITIGPRNQDMQLNMRLSSKDKATAVPVSKTVEGVTYELWDTISMDFLGTNAWMPWDHVMRERVIGNAYAWQMQHEIFKQQNWPHAIECVSLGPGPVMDAPMVRFWDRIALTDREELPVRALQMVVDRRVSRLAAIGDENSRHGDHTGRRVVVKLLDGAEPVPLRSLGDGAVRLFGVAVALTNCRDGFLTIDEAENGIHYSVQRDFWRMVMQVAHEANVQVLATTHSWDCVKGFAQASLEFGDAQGVLIRLERDDEGTRAVEYSEEDLEVAAGQGIEVR